jgi:hypothetical protein
MPFIGSSCTGLASSDVAFAFGGLAFAKDLKMSEFSRLSVATFVLLSAAGLEAGFCDVALFWRLLVLRGTGSFAIDLGAVVVEATDLEAASGGGLRPVRLCSRI